MPMDYIGMLLTGIGLGYSLLVIYSIFQDDSSSLPDRKSPPPPPISDETTPLLSDDKIDIRQRPNYSDKDSDEELIQGWDMV